MKKTSIISALCALLLTAALYGCGMQTANTDNAVPNNTSEFTQVTLVDDNTAAADGITVDGNIITITKGGKYSFSGTLTDGQIIVSVNDNEEVMISLNGVNITGDTNSAPLHIKSAKNAVLIAEGENILIDNGGYFGADNDDTAAIWSESDISIVGTGSLLLTTPGKGIHSEKAITLESGNITVSQSDEGIEASLININGGHISVHSSDDGINVSDGAYTADTLYINGGTLSVNAQGDGIDSNGAIVMTGGNVTVDGPTGMDNAALDYDKTFTMSGGTLIAVGSAGMAAVPSDGAQSFISANVSGKAGSLITVKNASNEDIAEYTPDKDFASIVVSTPDMIKGEHFTVLIDITEKITVVAGESNRGGFGGGFGGGFAPPDGEFAPPNDDFAPPADRTY
jgi:hypothetical protein